MRIDLFPTRCSLIHGLDPQVPGQGSDQEAPQATQKGGGLHAKSHVLKSDNV